MTKIVECRTAAEVYSALAEGNIPNVVEGNFPIDLKGTPEILLVSRRASPLIRCWGSVSTRIECSDSSAPSIVCHDTSSPDIQCGDSSDPKLVCLDNSTPVLGTIAKIKLGPIDTLLSLFRKRY
jgi:hypothetical protein